MTPTFDRFDVCEAYLAAEQIWHRGGILWERTGRRASAPEESVDVQLRRMGFKVGAAWKGWESLSPNGRAIYAAICERLRLGHGGYHDCACRDCFQTAIGWGRPMCFDCQEAGCDPGQECQAPGAYGEGDEEPEESTP